MPKGLPRSFSSFLRPRSGAKDAPDNAAEERVPALEAETSFSTTLDRVETTLDRMSRALFAVDTVPKAVARAKANQLSRAAGLREADGSSAEMLETTPALARSIHSRTSALARAAEELRVLELRVHEANAFTSEEYGGDDDIDARGKQSNGSSYNAENGALASEPPLLLDVVALGPDVIGLEPPASNVSEQVSLTLVENSIDASTPPEPITTPAFDVRAVPGSGAAPIGTAAADTAAIVARAPATPASSEVAAPLNAHTAALIPRAVPADPPPVLHAVPAKSAHGTTVQDEISLEVADDVNSDQLCQFLAVLPELMESILLSTASYANPPHARDEGVRARNALRQLELAADSVGIRGIANFSSHATSLLDALINTTASVPDEMFATLRDAMACLEHMSEVVWGKTKLADDVPERLEALIEAELHAILDLTLRVEEPSYSANLDPFSRQTRSPSPAASRYDSAASPADLPARA